MKLSASVMRCFVGSVRSSAVGARQHHRRATLRVGEDEHVGSVHRRDVLSSQHGSGGTIGVGSTVGDHDDPVTVLQWLKLGVTPSPPPYRLAALPSTGRCPRIRASRWPVRSEPRKSRRFRAANPNVCARHSLRKWLKSGIIKGSNTLPLLAKNPLSGAAHEPVRVSLPSGTSPPLHPPSGPSAGAWRLVLL